MNKARLLVEELGTFKLPLGTCLPAILNLLELSFGLSLEFGETQAVLLWNFGLENDLYLLRTHCGTIDFVSVVDELVADDLKVDITCQACLLIN